MQMSSTKRNMLVIDDDKLLCDMIQVSLNSNHLKVFITHSGEDGLAMCRRHNVDIVLLDQKLPDGKGRDFCNGILEQNDQTKIIFITAYPSFDNAVKGIQLGAFDYLSKPFDINELRLTVNQAIRTLELEKVEQIQCYKNNKDCAETDMIGSAGGLSETTKLIELAAGSDVPVIITGETGTGKNVAAKAIHYSSPHKKAALLSINCAALPENLIEAELFGYEKGAFTGAISSRKGIFEMADGGTLILDEIGEMPLHLQTKLLNVLEDGTIRRLGGAVTRSVHVRVIAVTNLDLELAVQGKRFRSDLYFRLNVIRIHIPPLRERQQDIKELSEYFVRKATNDRASKIPSTVLKTLIDYDWPGNVRELKNVIERAVVLQKEALFNNSGALKPFLTVTPSQAPAGTCSDSLPKLEDIEKNHILQTLEQYAGNLTRSACSLGISLSTLKRRLKNYESHAVMENYSNSYN